LKDLSIFIEKQNDYNDLIIAGDFNEDVYSKNIE